METANVGSNKKTVTTNMVVTYPGKDGIEILKNEQIINIKEYLEEVGNLKGAVLNNSEKELRAYLEKYNPEKLKEYDESRKKAKSKNQKNQKDQKDSKDTEMTH